MAIRIRFDENGRYIALCAAESIAKTGDVYLNDGMHEALSNKFEADFISMRFIKKQ